MSLKKNYPLYLMLFSLMLPQICEAIVLDRILAVVNGELILLSEVESEIFFFNRSESLPEGEGFSNSVIQKGIQNLIDHKLLLAEAKRFDVEEPKEPQIQEWLDAIQKRFGSPAEFERALRLNAMTSNDLKHKIMEHLIVNRFIDQRIRFFVIVLPEETSNYYQDHSSDFQGKSYEEVEKEIEKLLFEKKEKSKIEEYLSKIRNKSQIQINFESF